MDYEWDPKKAESNYAKHGIRFADAVGVFSDPYAMTIPDPDDQEERYVTIGLDSLLRITVVSYTWRDHKIRIISARRGARNEKTRYQRGL